MATNQVVGSSNLSGRANVSHTLLKGEIPKTIPKTKREIDVRDVAGIVLEHGGDADEAIAIERGTWAYCFTGSQALQRLHLVPGKAVPTRCTKE